MRRKRAKFHNGQVVHVAFMLEADAYGIITSEVMVEGRWLVQIREREHKVPESVMRPLTRREAGGKRQ
jgi:hypothetical protein